ncbi:MAG: HAD-IIB family hydrolase [Gammaproteobacteria bacterium]
MTSQLLLCTDMDRTVIPNGVQSEHKLARQRFSEFCDSIDVTLAYVTGRHLGLACDAIKHYGLPTPDYIVSDVGTKIYKRNGDSYAELNEWCDEIDFDWNGNTSDDLKRILSGFSQLNLQEALKQNRHKLSYYVSLHTDIDKLLLQMDKCLTTAGISASLIWSIDEPKDIGLLDVLPKNATKLHAVEFLYQMLGFELEEVVFAGDSGNDLPVMGSSVPSVLVANAAHDVRERAKQLAKENNLLHTLYLANGKNSDMNGNYTAGVLEGVGFFVPHARKHLQKFGFVYD